MVMLEKTLESPLDCKKIKPVNPKGNQPWIFIVYVLFVWASPVAQRLKHLPVMWETQVRSLGREDPLEKEMATHSSILTWRIPWMEEPGRLQSMGLQRVGHDWATSLHFTSLHFMSCLEEGSPNKYQLNGQKKERIEATAHTSVESSSNNATLGHPGPPWVRIKTQPA